jgi:hypothetical protein
LHLGGRRGDQGFGEPDAFPGQFPDDVTRIIQTGSNKEASGCV